MSKFTKNASHESNRFTTTWQPRPELRAAMRAIATIAEGDASAFISDREIEFANRGHRTRISAEGVDLETVDGHWISERITVRTPLDDFEGFADEHIPIFNKFATTGALVRDPERGDAIVSTLPVFRQDTEALADIYTPHIASAALMHLIGPLAAAACLRSDGAQFGPAECGLPGWDSPCAWDNTEFEYAQQRLQQTGFLCNIGPSGLTVEFPLEQGAVSAIYGHNTSRCRLHTDVSHPVAGNGLFYRLDLRVPLGDDELAALANRLNLFELNGVDTPPFFGAWCCQPESPLLSFVGFWPNLMFYRGTAAMLAFWCAARSRIAKQFIGQFL